MDEHHEIPENDNPWGDFSDDDDADAGPPPRHPVVVLCQGLLAGALPLGADVFRVLRIPISLVLATISCIYIVSPDSGAIKTVLAPICSIPIISLTCLAFEFIEPNGPRKPGFPGLLNIKCTNAESFLEETEEGFGQAGLALKMKHVEMETRDLVVTLVRISNFDSSRDVLADSLGKFIKDARKVSRGLTRFSSRVGVAVDNIIDCALSAIEAADAKSSAFSLSRPLPFNQSESATKQVVLRTFTETMNTLSIIIQRVVLEAEVSISDLNRLEEHLKSIHEVVSRDDPQISAVLDEIAARPWIILLGGDRKELREMDERRALLNGVGKYRDRARGHVVEALQYLEKTVEDMEQLRGRMAAPQLVGETVPIDIHIKRLRFGLWRLKERRAGVRTTT
ncbi:hypothetical protein EI94DRAFT_1807003 [Lactarius quietus]|nr:hypothetical protein EI94DRAFT_1807003 [Lactarius quietus]